MNIIRRMKAWCAEDRRQRASVEVWNLTHKLFQSARYGVCNEILKRVTDESGEFHRQVLVTFVIATRYSPNGSLPNRIRLFETTLARCRSEVGDGIEEWLEGFREPIDVPEKHTHMDGLASTMSKIGGVPCRWTGSALTAPNRTNEGE